VPGVFGATERLAVTVCELREPDSLRSGAGAASIPGELVGHRIGLWVRR
jgi:hypothetical protein